VAKRTIASGRRSKAELKFNLVENGIDFIRSGIEQYFLRDTPKARDHKYAVLHIFAGVLLLLKERLRRAHASLIFARVALIRFGGHLPKGGYDVQTDGRHSPPPGAPAIR